MVLRKFFVSAVTMQNINAVDYMHPQLVPMAHSLTYRRAWHVLTVGVRQYQTPGSQLEGGAFSVIDEDVNCLQEGCSWGGCIQGL
jgi:hypothetical protein